MYDRSSSLTDIDAVRLVMFAHKQRSYDSIPPTRAALTEHAKRAFGVKQHYVTWKLVVLVSGDVRSKATHGRHFGRYFHQLLKAAKN